MAKKKESMKDKPTSTLKAMLFKNSGATATEVRQAINELKSRGEETPPPSLVTGGRKMAKGGDVKKDDDVTVVSIGIGTMPKSKLKKMKKGMMRGGMANGKEHMYAAGGSVTDKLPNKGLKNLAKSEKGKVDVRKMGFDV